MRWLLCALASLALMGCHAFHIDVDGRIEQRASQPIDERPQVEETHPTSMTRKSGPAPTRAAVRFLRAEPDEKQNIVLVAARTVETTDLDKKPSQPLLQRLVLSDRLLGWKVPDISMPPANASQAEKDVAIREQFPPLPPLHDLPEAKLGPAGRPLSLTDLQQMALRTNPQIRQAHLDIDAARGLALQAGLYPNPSIGYEAGTVGQGDNLGQRCPGQQGGFAEQKFVTAGKLTLARAAALRDVQIHELKLKQMEADLQRQVRAGYFAVLAAQKSFESTTALAQLTDEMFNVLLLQMQAGEVAAYEPMQIRVLAAQARGNLVQAHNRYVAAWKQLAATLGTPGLTLTAVDGRIDTSVPHFEHDHVLNLVLAQHSDVLIAQVEVEKARLRTRLAEVEPYPDVTVHLAFQKDYAAPPFGTVANIVVGVPVPFWNRNQGNILAARAQLQKANEESQHVRNDLTGKVAGAFERYENNRVLLEMYKKQILPNQVQAFRAAVVRHAAVGDKGVSYNDLVNAQQTLAGLINSYLGALNEQWVSVVDIAHLLQTRDLFQIQQADEVAPIPDVYDLVRERRLIRR